MQIDAILFDKDGTLFDFEATWSGAMVRFLEQAVPPEKLTSAAQVMAFDIDLGRFGVDSPAVAGTVEDIARAVSPLSDHSFDALVKIMDNIAAETVPAPVGDLVACLTTLRDICPLGVVTNDSEAPARAQLMDAGITELFDVVSGFDSGNGVKPSPAPLLAAARALGAEPARTVMVGDSLHDLHGAAAAGMRGVGVLTGVATEKLLLPVAEVVLPDITTLADWLLDR